jgi:hypothetical protein
MSSPRSSCARPASGIVGSFHKVSAKYLPLYVAEFQFRYNNRFDADIFGTASKVVKKPARIISPMPIT